MVVESRIKNYAPLSTSLAFMSDDHLQETLNTANATQGWGVNQVLSLEAGNVFIKRVPLTQREYDQGFATHNLFDLPMYYHYGVGSAGFGAFRELLTHIKISNWVLTGRSRAFPLLYHYRILPATAPWKKWQSEALQKHVTYWNNNPQIAAYLKARQTAAFELVLCLEYVPYTLHQWASDHPAELATLMPQAEAALQELNARGILHLDAHFANLLTDGKQVFIGDFGLALDRDFELAPEEKDFFDAHQTYDRGQLWGCLHHVLFQHVEQLSGAQKARIYGDLHSDTNMSDQEKGREKMRKLLELLHPEKPDDDDDLALLALPQELTQLLQRHYLKIWHMFEFFGDLRGNSLKNTRWQELS